MSKSRGGSLLGPVFLVLLAIVWGTSWPVIKLGVIEMSPLTFRALNLAIGAIGFFAVVAIGAVPHKFPRKQWKPLILAGLFNMAGWQVLIAYGVMNMSSGHAALIGFTMPLWTVVFSMVILNERMTPRRMAALILGIGGILVLLSPDWRAVLAQPKGVLLTFAGAISWAIGTIIQKRTPWTLPTLQLTAWQVLIGAVPVVVLALIVEGPIAAMPSSAAIFAVVYSAIFALLIGNYLWFRVVRIYPASVAGIGTLMVPAIGVVSGAIVLGEPLGWREIGAMALIVPALALVLLGPQPEIAPPATPAKATK